MDMAHQVLCIDVLWSLQINSPVTVCKTSRHILQTALSLTHSTEPHIPTTPQPVLRAPVATGTLGALTGMGCPLLPQEPREKREL